MTKKISGWRNIFYLFILFYFIFSWLLFYKYVHLYSYNAKFIFMSVSICLNDNEKMHFLCFYLLTDFIHKIHVEKKKKWLNKKKINQLPNHTMWFLKQKRKTCVLLQTEWEKCIIPLYILFSSIFFLLPLLFHFLTKSCTIFAHFSTPETEKATENISIISIQATSIIISSIFNFLFFVVCSFQCSTFKFNLYTNYIYKSYNFLEQGIFMKNTLDIKF